MSFSINLSTFMMCGGELTFLVSKKLIPNSNKSTLNSENAVISLHWAWNISYNSQLTKLHSDAHLRFSFLLNYLWCLAKVVLCAALTKPNHHNPHTPSTHTQRCKIILIQQYQQLHSPQRKRKSSILYVCIFNTWGNRSSQDSWRVQHLVRYDLWQISVPTMISSSLVGQDVGWIHRRRTATLLSSGELDT